MEILLTLLVIFCAGISVFLYEYNKTISKKYDKVIKDGLKKDEELRKYRCRYGE